MGYKANEQDLMAYLYGELEGKEKERLKNTFSKMLKRVWNWKASSNLRMTLSQVKDKEVIAPPIFVGDYKPPFCGMHLILKPL